MLAMDKFCFRSGECPGKKSTFSVIKARSSIGQIGYMRFLLTITDVYVFSVSEFLVLYRVKVLDHSREIIVLCCRATARYLRQHSPGSEDWEPSPGAT